MRKILKEDNAALIADGNFVIEVRCMFVSHICITENHFVNNLIVAG